MRFCPEIRRALVRLVKKGWNKTYIAELFDTTRQTVHRWCRRAFHRGREGFVPNIVRKPLLGPGWLFMAVPIDFPTPYHDYWMLIAIPPTDWQPSQRPLEVYKEK